MSSGFQPSTPTFLASYGFQPASLQAVTDVIFGQDPTGLSPITIRTPDGSEIVAPLDSGIRFQEGIPSHLS
jgi:beta-N-acetylhexosaminidase